MFYFFMREEMFCKKKIISVHGCRNTSNPAWDGALKQQHKPSLSVLNFDKIVDFKTNYIYK